MPQIHILAVGKLREPHWRDATAFYAGRLRRGYELVETIVKDGDASLAPAERNALEGERLLQALKGTLTPVCLDEKGKLLSSVEFAGFLRQCFDSAKTPCFLIGGAFGLSEKVKERATKLISLSPMTFPHELARVLLYEQLYRADAILHGRPYHHA
ncbi:MAG: Ribosomal RNA large subunit methyltransferase H [Desulfovibrio sp.]